MTGRTAHVIGAGLAGLATAVCLVESGWRAAGRRLLVHEASMQAGGRCRSYYDATLGLVIDNGNHLTLSGNGALTRYLARIGATSRLGGPPTAVFDFLDLSGGERWAVRPNRGRLPWWILARHRRVPGTRVSDYLALARLMHSSSGQRVGEAVACRGEFWRRFLRPVLLAMLNTPPEEADPGLVGAVLRASIGRGGAACRPRIAYQGLAPAFVDPALAYLRAAGAEVVFNRRLQALEIGGEGLAIALRFGGESLALAGGDVVILAVPPWAAADLLPGLTVPDRFHAILNGHFRVTAPAGTPPLLGLVGGTAEWIFAFPQHLSVTVSGADALIDADREALARKLWADVVRALGLAAALPRWQVVKERRATFAATGAQNRRRPGARSGLANLFLAGDWTDTGLPATIEGAVRSGERAAALAMGFQR